MAAHVKTLTELRAAVYDKLGLPTTDGLLTTASVDRAINWALQTYSADGVWPWMISEATINTVSGTATYALPVGYTRTEYLIDTVGRFELHHRPARQLYGYEGLTGRPSFYGFVSGGIKLYPTPDGAFSLTHGMRLAEQALSSAGDVPLIPAHFTDYIVTISARLLAIRIKDQELRAMLDTDLVLWRKRMQKAQIQSSAYGRPQTFPRGY